MTARRPTGAPPPIDGLLETALYVADMARSAAFFRDVLGLSPLLETGRLTAFDAGRQGVLLVFLRGATERDMVSDRGTVPGHDGQGALHMAFAIRADTLDAWRTHLAACQVGLRGEMAWPAGGHSLYFEDPDGHVLELATPGLWPTY